MKIASMRSFCALFLLVALPLTGQEKEAAQPTQIQVVYETFSLPRSEAARSQRETLTEEALYARLVAGLEKGKVVQEKFLVIRSLIGRLSTVDHVSELIFPALYDPPETPNMVGSGPWVPTYVESTKGETPPLAPDLEQARRGDGWQEGTFPATPASAAAATTLKLGDSLEIEASIGADPEVVALTFTARHTTPAGSDPWGQGLARIEMPRFGEQKLQSKLSLKNGKPSLVGTVSPAANMEAEEEGERRVWFSFVTASILDL